MTYLRFGDLPASGRSRMLESMPWREGGVSVFEADATARGYVIRLGGVFQIHDLARVFKEDRPLYRVEGRKVGEGSSGEPLLGEFQSVEAVPATAALTVRGGGICSVYLDALAGKWSERRRAQEEAEQRATSRSPKTQYDPIGGYQWTP